jgi:acetoacetyl-CoA synthetase
MNSTTTPALNPDLNPIWTPSPERVASARITHFQQWLGEHHNLHFANYDALWQWSITDLNAFWQALFDFHQVKSHTPYDKPLSLHQMPGAQWFNGATLNFAEHVFAQTKASKPAIIYRHESGERREMSWAVLGHQVALIAQQLKTCGVVAGDRVVAYLPNTPETMAACLAVVSIGAIWSVCAPDMGSLSVLDRFKQIEPKVLIACQGYTYGGKAVDRRELVQELLNNLPTVKHLIEVPVLDAAQLTQRPNELLTPRFESLPFAHPMWIVYSSGTTGLPKPIVHGHGGVLLEALVTHLMADLGPNDRHLWLSSTGWIVWNLHMAGLLVGATICIYDGNPATPDSNTIWRYCEQEKITSFGSGAAFHTSNMKAGLTPNKLHDLSTLRTLSSTGSPLSPEAYQWLYREVSATAFLSVISGGTDFAGGFVTGNATLPIYQGEMQCCCLGHAVFAFNEQGQTVIDEVGELVCTQPLPSMPLYFWGDDTSQQACGQRYYESYFETFAAPKNAPNVIPWRHGDWMRITPRGGAIIYGRSDATINRHGIRMGTAELYRSVESFDQVLDSMVVDLEYLGRESYMPLFVVLREGVLLDDALVVAIKQEIRIKLSGRHVPNDVFQVPDIPRTITGKKLELPIKKLLLGASIEKVANPGAMANPKSLDWFVEFAKRF